MSAPKQGDLRIWWVPQMPMKAFEVNVPDLATASIILDTLGRYDAFQLANRIKPDYCNAGGLLEYDANLADWYDWECRETFDTFDTVRADPELLAAAIAHATASRTQEDGRHGG